VTLPGDTELEDFLSAEMRRFGVPAHDGSLVHYILDGHPMGHFLTNVVENNLRGAIYHADNVNALALSNVVSFLFNSAPADCWGSPEKVKAWIERRGLKGIQE